MLSLILSFLLASSVLGYSSTEQLTESETRSLLLVAGWSVEVIPEAVEVIYCESRRIPSRIGDDGRAKGLLQIHWVLPEGTWGGWRWVPEMHKLRNRDIMSPLVNLRAGLVIYNNFGGWDAWSCKPTQ